MKIFVDTADLRLMSTLAAREDVHGFTTNPTLMRQAGVMNYKIFASAAGVIAKPKPISFEVTSDNFAEMEAQARRLAACGDHVYVKIPITNTKGESSCELIQKLATAGIAVNVTAVMTVAQIRAAAHALAGMTHAILSVFAGRIADTGRDPIPTIQVALHEAHLANPKCEVLWASPREVLNVYQAQAIGCDITTVTPDLLQKLTLKAKSLDDYSRETVEMFYLDAQRAGLAL